MPDYVQGCNLHCRPSCDPKQLSSLDTGSGIVTEGPVYNQNLHRLGPASILSPDQTAILLMSDPSTCTILELPSLAVRGMLNPHALERPLQDPDPTWAAWVSPGSNIAVLWTTSQTHKDPQVAVYDAHTCKILRNTRIPVSARMDTQTGVRPEAVQAACANKMALSLEYWDGSRHMVRIALLDLTRDEDPFVHDFEISQGPYSPDIFPSPSGNFLAITMNVDEGLDGVGMGPDRTFIVGSMGRQACVGPFAFARTPIWAPSTSQNICVFPGQRTVLHLDADSTQLQRVPTVTASSPHQAYGQVESGFGVHSRFFPSSEDEDEENLDYITCDRPSRTTVDGGFISPCGLLMVALSTTERTAQIEHWPLDSPDDSNFDSGPSIVQDLVLPRFTSVFVPAGFAVSWHPTLQRDLIYALAVGSDTIYLIDGRRHNIRLAWTFHDSFPSRSPMGWHGPMKWSPDGIRLAIKGSESIFVMQTDVFADTRMFNGA